AFKDVVRDKYRGYSIYFHNLSGFDGILILNPLIKLFGRSVTPVIKDGRIIKINITFSKGKNKVTIMDSLQILPSSLDKLAKTFKVENKMIFPHKFLEYHNEDYVGEYPDIKCFY